MAILRLTPLFASMFFVLAIYFFAKENTALGAAMIAIAGSQLALFAAIKGRAAAIKRKRR